MSEFKKQRPLKVGEETLASIEEDEKYWEHLGKLYIHDNWLTVEQARALRDWLNEVVS